MSALRPVRMALPLARRLTRACALLALMALAHDPAGADVVQADFATPEDAAAALIAGARAGDEAQLLRTLGPDGQRLIHSPDPVAEREGRMRLVAAYDKAHRIQTGADGRATLVVGTEDWPMPIPLVRSGGRWRFDTEASVQKIIDRRVGRNELNVIDVCRAFVTAQREYAASDRLGDGQRQYASRFESSGARHDGLYWETAPGEAPSPLGPLIARARAQGYTGQSEAGARAPFHGYYFRILLRQGPHAPGGAREYMVGQRMTGGFALLAYPAEWGDTGIMTFIVNQEGIVFEKNLGPETARLAGAIESYDPDRSWHVAQ